VTLGTGARRCAVLGHPVAHSLSPLLHRTAYAALGLDWTYDAYDVTEEALPAFLAGLDPSWRGLSLTMPLKRAVLPLVDDLDATARAVGAANTVLLDPGHRYGANTDVSGLVATLRGGGVGTGTRQAVVLGGGATAASALAALARLDVASVELRVRDPARAGETAAVAATLGLDVSVVALDAGWPAYPQARPVVSTVPSAVAAAVLPDALLSGAVVIDARYDPWPSPLLQRAARLGSPTVTGIDLLVHQAVGQVQLMTGSEVAPGPLLAVALDAVQQRAGPRPRAARAGPDTPPGYRRSP
jgi:shikimate dehydrogenase